MDIIDVGSRNRRRYGNARSIQRFFGCGIFLYAVDSVVFGRRGYRCKSRGVCTDTVVRAADIGDPSRGNLGVFGWRRSGCGVAASRCNRRACHCVRVGMVQFVRHFDDGSGKSHGRRNFIPIQRISRSPDVFDGTFFGEKTSICCHCACRCDGDGYDAAAAESLYGWRDSSSGICQRRLLHFGNAHVGAIVLQLTATLDDQRKKRLLYMDLLRRKERQGIGGFYRTGKEGRHIAHMICRKWRQNVQ